MKNTAKKTLAMLLCLVMIIGLMPGMSLTAYATPAETLLTTITATGKEQANYSTANVATVSFSYTAGGSSAYLANWGWWGYGWTATVNAAEGYTITKCVFYDDANRTATDSEAPFVVETTEEDKTPQVNGSPILAYTSKGIKKIEVYGYATPAAHTHSFTYSAEGDTITATCGNDGCDLTDNKVTLRIVPNPVLYYDDGQPKEASLEGLDAFNAATGKNISTDDISYYKGDTNVTAQIKAGSGTSIKGATYTARLDVEGKRATVTFKLTQKPVAHTHSFSYAASGNVITATCNGAGTCDLANNQATLTLNAPAHTAYGDGKDANATFTGEIPGVNNPTIHYSKGDTPLSTAPTDAGTYKAWCQLGSATARVEYTIDKADAAYITEPEAKTLHYTGQPQELVTAGTATGGKILYTAIYDPDREPDDTQGDRPYTESIPEMTDPGTYYVWYKLEGGKNYNGVAAKMVAVTIGDPEASINFLGGSLRRRAYKGTDTIIDFETDLRFGFSFELPAGAVVDTDQSYFRWKLNGRATADDGNKAAMKNVGFEDGKHVSNMVITGVPKAFYQADINCFVHLVYTLDDMEFVMEANEDSNGDAYTRSVKQVCVGLLNNAQWGAYAQSLLDAIS